MAAYLGQAPEMLDVTEAEMVKIKQELGETKLFGMSSFLLNCTELFGVKFIVWVEKTPDSQTSDHGE
jgi:hypothetical protein